MWKVSKTMIGFLSKILFGLEGKGTRGGIQERTVGLRFLGIISRVLRLEFSTLVLCLSTKCSSWTNLSFLHWLITLENHRRVVQCTAILKIYMHINVQPRLCYIQTKKITYMSIRRVQSGCWTKSWDSYMKKIIITILDGLRITCLI